MSNKYDLEITDTYGADANYSWVSRHTLSMPELTHYGYDGATNYCKANKVFRRELVKKVKAIAGWTGWRCEVSDFGDTIEIRPRGAAMVAFVTYREA